LSARKGGYNDLYRTKINKMSMVLTRKVKFENCDENGKLSKYEILLDWSSDSVLNIIVNNEDDKEMHGALFREEIDLD